MKIALGMRSNPGPWGGGSRFIAALAEGLAKSGHSIVHDLRDRDIDVILLVDPRTRAPNVTFGPGQIARYVSFVNPSAIVVHRINECDERKGEAFINAKLVGANSVADWTVFVGAWLAELPVWKANLRGPWSTIRNGADRRIFNAQGFVPWTGDGPLRLVTHHWGYHRLKGFDVYEAIDARLGDPAFAARFSFTYIGNLPKGFRLAHSEHVPPLDGTELASRLRASHGYVTASVNEPGGNHQNEGAACGLPLIYRESGCMPEYCEGYGISFRGPDDFFDALDRYRNQYGVLASRMAGYPNSSDRALGEWLALFDRLATDRARILSARRRRPAFYMNLARI